MPNFITPALSKPSLPFSEGGYDFLWEANSRNSDYIFVRNDKAQFFLTIKQKDGGVLVKGEKISRPSQVLYIQQALSIYAQKSACELTFSNFNSNRKERANSIIKDINFFARKNFTADDRVYLEVGFGSGRHLLHQAKTNPNHLIIGVEIHKPSLEQVAQQCEILGLRNVALIDYDSRILMEFLPSNSIERIFVHFPIPWDKKPHRRVIGEHFAAEAMRVLKPSGTLELRTDSELYFAYAIEVFTRQNRADMRILKNFDLEISSKYEDRWKRLEKNIYDIIVKNHKKDEFFAQPDKLKFNFYPKIDNIIKNFSQKLFRGEGFFAHFESLHTKESDIAVIKAAFGANERAEHSFIIADIDGVRYFPHDIYATRANKMAHEVIEKWLNE